MTRPISLDTVSTARLGLRTDMARLTSGPFTAIQVDAGAGRRQFVIATEAEAERGWIPRDGRPRYEDMHAAFDAAHHLAVRDRREAIAA